MLNLSSDKPTMEVIREKLTPEQVMRIREEERSAGRLVNITRMLSGLVEIEIIHPCRVIDITARAGDSHQRDKMGYLN